MKKKLFFALTMIIFTLGYLVVVNAIPTDYALALTKAWKQGNTNWCWGAAGSTLVSQKKG